ncbi:MAG TPA: class I SAM-dependent methyltransferase [Steroidobacteraceae bacterium]|jgi:SAM-dependent methyltransferase|nr:class I SAM-dependent methyltransferase [Steroidobacteraceae bacterium]
MIFQDSREQEIIRSWHSNAAPWSEAIRTSSIASRKLVTDQAIIDAVASVLGAASAGPRVLDIGCGEGWLARALSALGMSVTGVDIVPDLIARAVASSDSQLGNAPCVATSPGSAAFYVQDYASIASRRWPGGRFDAALCNFSLLGGESVDSLLAALPFYLTEPGYLIIQTLHPVAACAAQPYQDGWREGNWQGFSGEFSNPAPWYFRTLESWTALLERCGFDILECREPKAPEAVTASSVIWIGKRRRAAQT